MAQLLRSHGGQNDGGVVKKCGPFVIVVERELGVAGIY